MEASTRRRGRPSGSQGDDLLSVARAVMLERGLDGATVSEVAARARISKSSLYREHASKDELYSAVVRDWAARGRGAMRPALDALLAADDVRAGLLALARTVQAGVLAPDVVRMRRLVAAESLRFPEVAAGYVADSWDANIADLAEALRELDRRGALSIDDPATAAHQITWLAVGEHLNARTLQAGATEVDPADLAAVAVSAVDTFLARYAPGPGAGA
ncbi:TetR/AcrR family transcriptional regulator [Nocardioides renjunii]|uniref:TetR/AcrR family transcriptional regulator n=1 Tax=Nocardioides renjunii TaxID=3095075 RepID=UPI002AFF4FA1|nr:TetR/AcrR family transcriptional regulator [Nocardioides sp. S-34]WQQ23269.1 TetR/AcrR family transcriptional regulator [Nocardioides sp. S-34]